MVPKICCYLILLENVRGLNWALVLWFISGVVTVGYLEYRESKRGKKIRIPPKSNWVMENQEDDDSLDLLHPSVSPPSERGLRPYEGMEVQLQPLY